MLRSQLWKEATNSSTTRITDPHRESEREREIATETNRERETLTSEQRVASESAWREIEGKESRELPALAESA